MDKLSQFLKRYNTTSLAGPVLIIMILGMMILPLPAFLLDIFFTFNIFYKGFFHLKINLI